MSDGLFANRQIGRSGGGDETDAVEGSDDSRSLRAEVQRVAESQGRGDRCDPGRLFGSIDIAAVRSDLLDQVARKLDLRLTGLAKSNGLTYTRYADDLTFSGGPDLALRIGYLMSRVRHIAEHEGFTVNEKVPFPPSSLPARSGNASRFPARKPGA